MCSCINQETSDVTYVDVPLQGLGIRLGVEPIAPVTMAFSEGKAHMLYELQLSGFDPRTIILDSLEVFGVADDTLGLARYSGNYLSRIARSPAGKNPLFIEPGSISILFLAIESEMTSLDFIYHKVWLSYQSSDGLVAAELLSNPMPITRPETLILDSPLTGGPWYAHAGPADISHHRTTVAPRAGTLTMDQRFAIDWLKLKVSEENGVSVISGPDWDGTIGTEVLAVADGIVASVQKGVPDEPIGEQGASGTEINWDTIGGNQVVIDLGEGRYAWYHHLQKGSINVRVGEHVSRGQVLGRIGNSGNTSHPHLHFEVTDAASLGLGDGLPYSMRCYDLIDRIIPMPNWDEVAESDPSLIGLRRRFQPHDEFSDRIEEIPLGGSIVRFPKTPDLDCGESSVD